MKQKCYSQRIYLFFFYGLFITFLLCIFFVYFYISSSKSVYQDAKKKSENLCASIDNSITTELNNLSTISMNIVYSNAIKENFTSFAQKYTQLGAPIDDLSVSRKNALAIYDIITAIIGPFQSASQINLYTLNGMCVGSGYFQRVTNVDLESIPWYHETIKRNGFKYISKPLLHLGIPAEGENQLEHKFISLTRMFLNASGDPEGIVEVIQDCNILFSLIPELKRSNPAISFYVYNERNELVYPYTSTEDMQYNYLQLIKDKNLSPLKGKMIDLDEHSTALVTYKKLDPFDWTIIVSEPKATVYMNLQSLKISLVIIIIVSMFITLFMCFIISNKLTYPLSKLMKAAKKLTLNRVLDENKKILTSADSNIKEISELCESFRDMYEKLRTSSQEILLLKSEETRAKLQATQSLINPHFLYNNLTNISIMAEEKMNENIIKMCHALCDYFRYISSNSENIVSLENEIAYTEKYIECMEMRYEDEFIYECHIEPKTKKILIPKLIIQPLVENVFKYGFNNAPPWHLKITSAMKDNNWLIHIEDNGGRLTNDTKKELLTTFDNLNKDEELKSLEIGGMGLKNIYLRLHLLYGAKAIFLIDNEKSNRTIFTIGGPIHLNKEDFYGQHPQI